MVPARSAATRSMKIEPTSTSSHSGGARELVDVGSIFIVRVAAALAGTSGENQDVSGHPSSPTVVNRKRNLQLCRLFYNGNGRSEHGGEAPPVGLGGGS